MQIERFTLREVQLPFRHFFETSFGRTYDKEAILVQVEAGELAGWGECVAAEGPFYSYEDVETAWHVLNRFLLPPLIGKSMDMVDDWPQAVSRIRGHHMAKAAAETALWDLKARHLKKPLWQLLGGTRSRIPCGVSIGIQDKPGDLLIRIGEELSAGYLKIKIKIKPGWDLKILELVRNRFPDIPLMVDANSAYTLQDLPLIREFDRYNLMMIEQPLYNDDLIDHSRLQEQIATPICLDESICHVRDASHAIELGACRVINIKSGRLGGLKEAMAVHDLCQQAGIPVWCGGMLETGIGRAHNIALSTLNNFSVPGDVSASRRYFERDLIQPGVEVSEDGHITAPVSPGIGYEVDIDFLRHCTVREQVINTRSGQDLSRVSSERDQRLGPRG
jgi:O-succinylbenzoate synthase